MKKKQLNKLMTEMQLKESLVRNKKLKSHRVAIINMDTLFRGFVSFTMDQWWWTRKLKHVRDEDRKGKVCEFIEVEYLINDIVKMRYKIKLKVKEPHKHYVIHLIPRSVFAFY